MLANDITEWLNGNTTPGYREYLRQNEAEARTLLKAAGLAVNSEIGEFYLEHGADTVRGWYDLLEVDELADATGYAHEELGVPARFVALTGTEGQGIVLYDTASHAVFDVEFGQFDALADGALAPIAATFSEFLRWCMAQDRGD
jgi:hypothetical protein